MTNELMWQSIDEPGFEHVRLDRSHPGWDTYDSMLVRAHGEGVVRGGYTLVVDKQFRTLEIRIMVEQQLGSMAALHLLATGDGTWTDADERHIPELDGCIDVDIQWSPLTNTLPIRRLRMQPGDEAVIAVAYIQLPALTGRKVAQHYTKVDQRTARYASDTRDFVRDLSLDGDGFVIDYPDLFQRAFPRP